MEDAEIERRREELQRQIDQVHKEWIEYDERYPGLLPSDYWDRQRAFCDRLGALQAERRSLPATRREKAFLFGCLILILVGAVWLVWWLCF